MLEYDPDDMVVNHKELKVGQYLESFGRDNFGKAVIVGLEDNIYTIVTDFGNTLRGDINYIEENFDLANTFLYVTDLRERFGSQLEIAQKNYELYVEEK